MLCLLRFPFKIARHLKNTYIKDTEEITMRTWLITTIAIKPETEAKRTIAESADVPWKCRSMFAPMCHAFKVQPKLHIMQPELHNNALHYVGTTRGKKKEISPN